MNTCDNHQHCIDDAMKNAHRICANKKLRLTATREQVLRLVWQSHRPLGAYELLDMLSNASDKRIAPPTVYRALEFLLEVGLIHRINSLNAYIGCPEPSTTHPSYFFICTGCNNAQECSSDTLHQQVQQAGDSMGFSIQQQWLEVLGVCQDCQSRERLNSSEASK